MQKNNIGAKYFSGKYAEDVGGKEFEPGTIGMCKVTKNGKKTRKELGVNLAHELGHHFMATRMTDKEIEQRKTLHNKSTASIDFVRPYAQKNYKEDFACCFEDYLTKKPKGKVLKEKYDFVTKRL